MHIAGDIAAGSGGAAALPYLFAGVSGAVAVAGVLTARTLYRRLKAAEAEASRLARRLDHDLSSELAFIVKPGRLLPASPATLAFLEAAAAAQARRGDPPASRADLAALLGEAVAERMQRPVAALLKSGERFRLEAPDGQGGRWIVLGETVGSRAVLRLLPAAAADDAPEATAAAEASAHAEASVAAATAPVRAGADPQALDLWAMIEAAPTGVIAFDAERRLSVANETALRLLRLPASWAGGAPSLRAFLDQLHRRQRMPEQPNYSAWRDKVLARPAAALAAPGLWALPNGDALRVWTAETPSGGLALFVADETSALASERRFKVAEGARRATVAAVDQGLALIGGEGSVQLLNPAFARLWSLDESFAAEATEGDEAGRVGLDQLAAAASRGGAEDRAIWAQIEAALRFEPPRRIQRFTARRMLAAQGGDQVARQEQTLAFQITPLPDGASLISCSDVSDAEAAERALRERAEALEAADRLKTDFLTDMAYQLRTPLNAVIGFADMLNQGLAGPLQERQKAYVGYVLAAADDLRELVTDALDLGALRSGSLTLRRAAFDLAGAAGTVASMAERRAERRRAEFEADIAPIEMPLFGDERRIRHAFFSAISAVLNTAEQGDRARLTVGAAAPGRAVVEVNLERVRPRKKAAGEAEAAEAGRDADLVEGPGGVSLSLARRIVEAHGGETAAGGGDQGLWIRFELPLDPEAGSRPSPPPEPTAPPRREATRRAPSPGAAAAPHGASEAERPHALSGL